VRCASAGAERPEGGLRAGPAYVVIPQALKAASSVEFVKHACYLAARPLHGGGET
jgi:hypothetical protein